jgi:endonuclease/exonuclease/phosphatase (EEP) superfamily protein YafD
MARSSLTRRILPAALGAVAATILVPDLLKIDRRLLTIAAVAWRPHAVVSAALAAAALSAWRPARPAAAALAAVSAAGAAAVIARVPRPVVGTSSAGGRELTILSVNVLTGRADTGDLAALISREAPDLVVLPEAGCDYRDKLAPLIADIGYRGWASTPPGVPDIMGVVVFGGPAAGDLQVTPRTELHYRHLRVSGGILGDRELRAVHTAAPRTRRLAARWLRELAHVGEWTRAWPAPIVVGDLNATLDNGPLRRALGGCVSAATGLDGLVGTFPSSTPRWFGIHIDHVLVPAGTTTLSFAVRDVAGTDHRGVVTKVRLPTEH